MGQVTSFGDEPQNLDDDGPQAVEQQDASQDWDPPEDEPQGGPIKAWSSNSSTNPYYQGMQSVQLKTVGHTHKAAAMKFFGSNPEAPSKARLEITQHRKVLGVFDFDAPPEIKFYLENDEIQVLKAFLSGQFLPADGYYVRVDSKEIAQEVA